MFFNRFGHLWISGNAARPAILRHGGQLCRLLSTIKVDSSVDEQNRRFNGRTQPILGQPTPWSHPHVLRANEIATGITVNEFKQRRQRVMAQIQAYGKSVRQNLQNHVVVIPSASKKYMTDKIPYVFRQNTDFYYLTGCLEPDTVLIMWIDDSATCKSALFMRPKDKHAELWDGPRTGAENAVDYFGVDEAYASKEIRAFLDRYVQREKNFVIWYDQKTSELVDTTTAVTIATDARGIGIEIPTVFIHRERLIKSPSEIQLMRRTCEIASNAINRTMQESRPDDSEHHIFARVDYHSRMDNASFLAYPPVVAGGSNATTIHYINNSQIVRDGQLVLMDAGCEYGGYSSDITRTWPINGTFTSAQAILYDVILTLQKDLLATLLQHGGKTLDELFDTMCLKLGFYLQEVGLIPKTTSDMELARAAYSFCPHHVSHYLGMDIHDTPLIARTRHLIPGMVFTVEPGLYIAHDRQDVAEEFRGIGIRIEDDVVINSDGTIEILTAKCIKERDELKQLIRSS